MLLIDTGAIAEMKRKMAAASAPPSPIQPMPQAPIQAAPPLLAPPPEAQLPLMQEPPPITGGLGPKVTRRDSLMARINDFGRPDVPEEMKPFLTPTEQFKAAEGGGLLSRIGTQLLGLGIWTPKVQAAYRAAAAIQGKDELAKRNDAATLKEQMAALRQKYANGGGDFKSFAAELAMLRPELSAQLAGMVNAMEPPVVAPPKPVTPASLQREDNVMMPDGTGPWIVWTDPQTGEIVRKTKQYVAPKDTSVGQALQAQRDFQRVTSLQGDYANNPVVKQAQLYASAYQGIQAAASENNPQSNLALMYEAVKMRDPNAVREGELKLQAAARSVPGWLRAMWDKAEKGNVLTPIERQQIVAWAGEKVKEQDKLIKPIQKRFGDAARRFGVSADSAYIAPSPTEGISLQPSSGPKKFTLPNGQVWERK